jgi:hypothetical protein
MAADISEQSRVDGGMSGRAAAWLARCVCAASLLLLALSLLIVILGWSTPLPGGWLWEEQATIVLVILGAPVVGGFIASNRPGNSYGWLWLGFGAGLALSSFGQNYALYTAWVRPGSLPAPGAVYALAGAGSVSAMVIFPFLLLLFPDGRLPSPRWRIVAWVAALAGGLILLLGAFRRDQRLGPIESPLGVGGTVGEAIVALTDVGLFVVFFAGILGALSLVFRYRHAAGMVRQQIKWFAYAAAVWGLAFVVSLIVDDFDLLGVAESIPHMAWVAFNNVPLVILYVAIGLAVVKHRLYDIDVIINRTLVYGSLTVVLAATYEGVVVLLQHLFRLLTGQESQVAAVVTTLLIAALFEPLRRLLQHSVDRRFYRSQYDARKTLEAFSATLRDETDLGALSNDLVGVVRETMQPAHVSLWLRPDTGQKGGQSG